jgi:hypothetical protein
VLLRFSACAAMASGLGCRDGKSGRRPSSFSLTSASRTLLLASVAPSRLRCASLRFYLSLNDPMRQMTVHAGVQYRCELDVGCCSLRYSGPPSPFESCCLPRSDGVGQCLDSYRFRRSKAKEAQGREGVAARRHSVPYSTRAGHVTPTRGSVSALTPSSLPLVYPHPPLLLSIVLPVMPTIIQH